MIVFILIVTAILTSAAVYIGIHFITLTEWGQHHSQVVWLTVALFVALQLAGPILYRTFPSKRTLPFAFQWIVYSTMGLFACMFFYTAISDFIIFGLGSLFDFSENLESSAFILVVLVSIFTTLMGAVQALRGAKVYEVQVPIENLPESLKGFRIAQISDLHVGPIIGKNYADSVVDAVNELKPDLITLTGDLADGQAEQLREEIRPLSRLSARFGIVSVTGNHEYYWGPEGWMAEAQSWGAKSLVNKNMVIFVEGNGVTSGANLAVAGIPDVTAKRMKPDHAVDLQKALEGISPGTTTVLLSHNPSIYKRLPPTGVHLVLSGHTHGGQFFPWSMMVRLAHRYWIGLNRHNDTWIYVNRGTGFWGPPIRFGVPAEITLITLC